MFAICSQILKKQQQKVIQSDMQQILLTFEDIFYKPKQSWEVDHFITLKEGIKPVNVRPYRYAYFWKAEIEKQVHDMLKLGLIKPSTSPFSSLVLLVKKKTHGDFVLIIVHWMLLPLKTYFLSLP